MDRQKLEYCYCVHDDWNAASSCNYSRDSLTCSSKLPRLAGPDAQPPHDVRLTVMQFFFLGDDMSEEDPLLLLLVVVVVADLLVENGIGFGPKVYKVADADADSEVMDAGKLATPPKK